MKLVLTKRGQKRIASNRKYLEDNFYLETGRRFEDNVLETIRQLPANPQLGREAFPELDRSHSSARLTTGRNYGGCAEVAFSTPTSDIMRRR